MIRDALWLFGELLVLFLGVSFGLALLRRRLGDDRLRSLMGASPIKAALRGITIGFITPFCTYSAIPVLVSLRQAGVPPAGYVAFIVAAPVLDPVLFGALAIIVGIPAALIYLAVAFTAALMLALLAEKVDLDRFMKPLATADTGPSLGQQPRGIPHGKGCASSGDPPWARRERCSVPCFPSSWWVLRSEWLSPRSYRRRQLRACRGCRPKPPYRRQLPWALSSTSTRNSSSLSPTL